MKSQTVQKPIYSKQNQNSGNENEMKLGGGGECTPLIPALGR